MADARQGALAEGQFRGCRSVLSSALCFAVLAKPKAFAVHLEDLYVVGQAAKDGAGEAPGAEDLGLFVEGQVQGDDYGAALMALGDYLEG